MWRSTDPPSLPPSATTTWRQAAMPRARHSARRSRRLRPRQSNRPGCSPGHPRRLPLLVQLHSWATPDRWPVQRQDRCSSCDAPSLHHPRSARLPSSSHERIRFYPDREKHAMRLAGSGFTERRAARSGCCVTRISPLASTRTGSARVLRGSEELQVSRPRALQPPRFRRFQPAESTRGAPGGSWPMA